MIPLEKYDLHTYVIRDVQKVENPFEETWHRKFMINDAQIDTPYIYYNILSFSLMLEYHTFELSISLNIGNRYTLSTSPISRT